MTKSSSYICSFLCLFAYLPDNTQAWNQSNSVVTENKNVEAQERKNLIARHQLKIIDFLKKSIIKKELRIRNSKKYPLQLILQRDRAWVYDSEFQVSITENFIAQQMKVLVNSQNWHFSELMLTDSMGALVATFPTSSDYWQGDEEKFIRAAIDKGFFVSKARWDESTKLYTFHTSIAVMENEQLIGVFIAGVDVTPSEFFSLPLEELLKIKITE